MILKLLSILIFTSPLFAAEHVYLKTPQLTKERIIGAKAGIRPYRKTGIRLEAEYIQDKLILHNYGYGGSGLTLSFGGAQETLDLLNKEAPSTQSIAVLGAGVVGLAAAHELLEKGFEVHIYSEDWSPNLTSNVAAGIWSPPRISDDLPDARKNLYERMLKTSESRFLKSVGSDPEFQGIRLMPHYSFKSGNALDTIKPHHRGEEVIVHFDNGVTKSGHRIYQLGLEGKVFIEDLLDKIKNKGAHLHQKYFENLDDVLNIQETVIINCTSLGSQKLFNDQEFYPVRGQLVYFEPQADIDYLFYQNVPGSDSTWVCIYPWEDRLILGGIIEPGETSPETNSETLQKMIENMNHCLNGIFDPPLESRDDFHVVP